MVFRIGYEKKQKLKKYWYSVAFFGGFIFDILTLGRPDHLFGKVALSTHIFTAGFVLALLYASIAQKLPEAFGRFVSRYGPLLVQFAFGSLLSGSLIFYSQSGSWSTSWPFLMILLGVMVGNETIHNRTQQLLFNLIIFFLGIFSYTVLYVPIFLKMMGPWIFVGSGLLSLVVIFFYIQLLRRIVPNFIELHLRSIVFFIGMTFCTLNFLYFENIIPPIPLSLIHIDVYHTVTKVVDGYQLSYEKAPWYKFWRRADTTYHYQSGDTVYCFASVFAPADFSLDVFHRWEYYDGTQKKWVTKGRISYHMSGGRDSGFRGYTLQENVREGKWRCSVETERGQIIGRETFTIKNDKPVQSLETVTE